jgi:glycerol-3-phosphate acyltransferase PlsY
MDWSWVLLAILCYLFGSFPSAFIFVELKLHKDIRSCGSGNVGALNSYEVTGSKWVGLLVLGVDFLKGILAVLLAGAMFGDEEPAKMLATLFVVIGHNYPVWLKFKGGRGLATIAGATLLFLPVLPLTWIGIWLLLRIYTSSVHFCNVFASVMVMLMATILSFFSPEMGYYFAFLLCSLILLSHKNVLRAAYLRQ